MSTVRLTIPKPHENQMTILNDKHRFRVVICGRRFGKTELAKTALLFRMLKGQTCWYIAPTFKQGLAVFQSLANILRDLPTVQINRTRLTIQFNDGAIEVKSADIPDNLRGAGLDFVVLDECAFMHPSVWAEVVQPMLLTTLGDALFITSPNGRNWLYNLYSQHHDGDDMWVCYRYTSYDNPLNSSAELDRIKGEVPESVFRQEYLAEFLEGGGAVFRRVADAVRPMPPIGGRIVFGVDWGQERDYTVIVAMDAMSKAVVEVDRFNQIGWDVQRSRLQAMAQRLNPVLIVAELNSMGSPNVEALQRLGLPVEGFTMTHASKVELVNTLQLAFEQMTITLPDNATLLNELQSYTMRRSPSGVYQYSAPSGAHDDTVVALALAYHAGLRMSARAILW